MLASPLVRDIDDARYCPFLSSAVPARRVGRPTATLSMQTVVGTQAPLISFENAIVTCGPEQLRLARVVVSEFVGRADARDARNRATVLAVKVFMLFGLVGLWLLCRGVLIKAFSSVVVAVVNV